MFGEDTFLWIVFGLLALSSGIQMFYYLWYYLAPSVYKAKDKEVTDIPVSVIICARNEAANLEQFLPHVLAQDYPDYEVIVVNDCSEDNSYEVLGKLLSEYPHLRISTVNKDPKFTHNKKFAQFIGIKAAKNEILVFTDADCQPGSDKWLSSVVSNFTVETDIVLGYGGYFRQKGLLNAYIRYDTMWIALSYLGMAIRGIPYMGVGRNLAYRKSLFFEKKGFGTHSHIISGDDDLFVNSNATSSNCRVEFRHPAHTRSVPAITGSDWIKQKKRHFTTAPLYRLKHKLLLSLEPFTRLIFYISFIILVTKGFSPAATISVFGSRLLAQSVVFTMGCRRLNEKGIVIISIFFDIFSPLINSSIYISGLLRKPGKNIWK